jgi:hypothetical protein
LNRIFNRSQIHLSTGLTHGDFVPWFRINLFQHPTSIDGKRWRIV